MADFGIQYPVADQDLVAVIKRADGHVWAIDAFQWPGNIADGDWPDILLTMYERDSDSGTGTGFYYLADGVPAALPAGDYQLVVYLASAAGPSGPPVFVEPFSWSGTALVGLSNLAAYVDTEVAAIKAVTDGLGATLSSLSSAVATVGGYVDTEVAAIKAVTDGLGSTLSTLQSGVSAVVGYVDTEIGAIKTKTDALPSAWPTHIGNLGVTAGGKVPATLATADVTGNLPAAVNTIASDAITASAIAASAGQELADALLDRADGVETGVSVRQALQRIGAGVAGKCSGAGTSTEIYVGLDGVTERLRVEFDDDNNRTEIEYDP